MEFCIVLQTPFLFGKLRFVGEIVDRQSLKVLIKLFQKFAVSRGGAFRRPLANGRNPFAAKKRRKGAKQLSIVLRGKPSPGVFHCAIAQQ